ncbi:MAG: hypothetical protein R3F43_09330 [bacterium]
MLRRVPETPPEPQVPPSGGSPAIVQAPTPVALADLEGLLMQALERGASDVHRATGEEPTLRVEAGWSRCRATGTRCWPRLVSAWRAALEADGAQGLRPGVAGGALPG